MKRIAYVLALLPSVVLATTAPVTVSNTPPALGGPCKTVAAPANMFMVNMTTGEGLRCNGTYPAEGVWVAWPGGTGGDSVQVDGVASTDPDIRSTVDIDAIRCTGVGAPDASCLAAEDVIFRVTDPELSSIQSLTSAADRAPYYTGAGTAALATLTAQGRSLIDDADQAAQQATLGLVPGTNVQAFNSNLTDLADGALTPTKVSHDRAHQPMEWNVLMRSNYDGNGDATNDNITWPGYTGTASPGRKTILNVGTNTSGIAWSEKYQVWIIVTNGVEDLDGDATADDQMWMGDINGTRIWAGPLPGGTRDWESLTLTDPYSDYIYALTEQASQDILEFDIRELFRIALGTAPTTVATWDIDAVDTTACVNGSNGYEGMTFVPDRTQCTSYVTTDMPCGYFLLECQANAGTFYKFRLDTGGTAVSLLDNSAAAPCSANDTTGDGDALDTDWQTGLIYQSIGGGQDLLLIFDAAFNCFARMALPNGGATDYEGFAIGPSGIIGTCDDAGGDCHTYQWPVTSPARNVTTPLITDTHVGLAIYSDATAATHDTGALVCGVLGRRCVTTYSPAGTNQTCANDYNTGSPAPFYAVCR